MASPSTPVLLGILEPWLIRARERLVSVFDVFADMDTLDEELWIQWVIPAGGAFTVQDVEAMELLELFARVDFPAAWKTLLDITKNGVYLDRVLDAASAQDTENAVYVRYKIDGLSHSHKNSTLKQALRWLLFDITVKEHSPMYYAARQVLMQCWTDRHHRGRVALFTRGVNDRINLRFDINLTELEEADGERMLEDVATVAMLTEYPDGLELYPSWQEASGHHVSAVNGVFKLKDMIIHFDPKTTTDAMLASIKEIRERTNTIVDWVVFRVSPERLSQRAAMEFFRSMIVVETTSTPLATLDLCSDIGSGDFAAACSAIQSSKKLREVNFEWSKTMDHRLVWAWIAYAIFSADAAHNITSPRLDVMDLNQEHIDIIEQVLNARDPLVVVWNCMNGQFDQSAGDKRTRTPAIVEIKPRATLLVHNERGVFQTENRVETLRIVDDCVEKQHVCVLYPGAGFCWVHRSEIVQRRDLSLPRSFKSNCTEVYFEVSMDTDINALARLITLIGSDLLRTVQITGADGVFFDDAFFSHVFAACAGLRRLDVVSAEIESFQWFDAQGSRLWALSLSDVRPRTHDGYQRLLSTIGSGSTELTKLHIQLPANELQQLMTDVEQMLLANSRIEWIFLSVHIDEYDKELVTTLTQRLETQSGTVLGVQRLPLARKCKLAFLSIFSCSRLRSSPTCSDRTTKTEHGGTRSELDAVLIATIFQFAAPCKQRVCGFVRSITTYGNGDEDNEDAEHSDSDSDSDSSED